MEKLSMCRICLTDDILLNSIVDTHLEVMYESLTMMPFVTEDRSPILACDICCSKLEYCHKLRQRCIQSETLFTQLLRSHVQVNLQILPDMHPSMEDVLHEETSPDVFDVKTEDAEDVKDDSSASAGAEDDTGTCSMIKTEPAVDYVVRIKFEEDQLLKKDEDEDEQSDVTANALIPEPPASSVQMSSDASTSRTLEHTGEKYKASKRLKVKRSSDSNRRTRKGEKPYQCEECHKCFRRKQQLVIHCRTHTGEKPYGCKECQKCFNKKHDLDVHCRTHTGEKPYQCNECNKCFSHRSNLSHHIRTKHTAEKPFKMLKCTDCDKCFSDKSNLNRHSRTHTGEKPFKCTDCNKCFSDKSNLNQHRRTHTGEKPFKCTCRRQLVKSAVQLTS